jgi:hypothetical protein
MELITILNRCHRFRGLSASRRLQCRQEAHRSSRAAAQAFDRSLLALPFAGPGYDQLAERCFESFPYGVSPLLYCWLRIPVHSIS